MAMTSRGVEMTLTEAQATECLAAHDIVKTGKGWIWRPKEMASDDRSWLSPVFADKESAIADAYYEMYLGDAYLWADGRLG